MRPKLAMGIPILLLGACLALLGGDPARADEKAAPGVWVFDVRIVRVDPPTKEGAEAPHPFADAAGSTTKLGWREALGLLKQRGTTTILMDQNVTTLDDQKAVTTADRTVPIMALNFANRSDEQKRASNVKTGCKLEVTPGIAGLRYALRVQWALQHAKEDRPPEQFIAEWNGSHPNLAGETLVLHYREQVAQGESTRAVEIYGLVTGRFLAR